MMSDRETAVEIEEAAALWVLRLDRTGRTPELLAELETWLAEDNRRPGALLAAEAAWAMLDGAYGVGPATSESHATREAGRLGRRGLLSGLGVALAASVVGGVVLLRGGIRFSTAVGEIRRVPLEDGSTAAINTDSDVEIAMTSAVRTVRIDRGEAWFQVARNPARPFVVEAGPVRVRAVGTAFSVRLRADGADVMVTEGVVETWVEGAPRGPVRLQAGSRAFVAQDAVQLAPPASSDVDRLLAWRAGRVDLAGETLGAAAAEFNRYNTRKIVVAPGLEGEQFFGVFRTDDPAGFARAIQSSLHVPVSFADPAVIRIGAGGG